MKFLLGAIDRQRQLTFIHTGRKLFAFPSSKKGIDWCFFFLGPQPFTADTAKKVGDLQTKAQLAMNAKENGKEVGVKEREAIEELESKSRMNHFGVGAEGFQIVPHPRPFLLRAGRLEHLSIFLCRPSST